MATETSKSALYIYRLTFGNKITAPDTQLAELKLEQGIRKEFKDQDRTYYLTFRGVKVNRKIYQPTEIAAELDFMQQTVNATGEESTKAPAFSDVSGLLLQRQVKLEILHVNRQLDAANVIDYGNTFTVAENCYVFELNPQLKRENNGAKMYVKLGIFSMDKLMTLNKYSKAYVARKLGSGILQPESLTFGTQADESVPLVETNIEKLRFLRYSDSYTFKDDGGKELCATISSEFIHPYLVQYNESFYDFMVRTSNRCGEFLFFEDGKLTLGLPDSGEPTVIDEYETVTVQDISAAPLTIEAYRRDSMKQDKGELDGLNQSVVDIDDSDFPMDAFPENTSSNAELATDEYIFPLYKDKFTDIKREMYYDGSASEVAMSRVIPFLGTLLENESDYKKGIPASIAKALIAGEAVTLGLSALQVSRVNKEKGETYLEPLKNKSEQYNSEKAVQFGTLNPEGWTTLDYYQEIRQHEEEQQRQIVCINMGTNYIPVKLGQKIKIDGTDEVYVIIQIQQVSEEAWSRDYDRYGIVADDKYTGKRLLKIYAIPAYGDAKDKFIPPVQPIPVIRKSGPQTAFVTDNEDPKFQGRVRIAYPWQSLGKGLKRQLSEAESRLKEAETEKARLTAKKYELLTRQTALAAKLEELNKFMSATPEEREKMLADKAAKRAELEASLKSLLTQKAEKEAQVTAKEEEISELKRNGAKQKAIEQKQVELEVAKKMLLENDIEKLNVQIKAKQKEIAAIDQDIADMKAAINAPDEILARVKKDYNDTCQEYKDTSATLAETEKQVTQRTEEKEKVKEIVEKEINDMASPWIRIASPMATEGGGTFFRPRVGDEVLVNFDSDNIERPYVVGSLFSKNHLTPDEEYYRKAAPELQWKNVSMALTSPNGHHITFTDPSKGGSFFTNLISPGLGFYGSVLGFNDFAPDAKDLAGGIHIGDRYGMYEIEMKSHKRAISISSPFGTVDISAFSGISIEAPNGDVTIKGKNVNIEAGNKITVLSGKNIADPGLGDPDGKANYVGKVITGVVGEVASQLTDKFVSSVVDLSLTRHVIEVFVRPIDGTLKLKSKRFLMMEAGQGNATIRADRYRADIAAKDATSQAFYKSLLTCINYIDTQVDEFFTSYENLWHDAHQKLGNYKQEAGMVMTDRTKADIAKKAFEARIWDDGKIKQDLFKDHFAGGAITYKGKRRATPEEKYEVVENEAKAYGKAAYDFSSHWICLDLILNNMNQEFGNFNWVKSCVKDGMALMKSKRKDDFNYWDGSHGTIDEKTFDIEYPDIKDPLAMPFKKLFKRRLLLCFLKKVSEHANNKDDRYFTFKVDIDKALTSKSLEQGYYWNRTVFNMDRKIQNNFLRTLYDSTIANVWETLKDNLPTFDREIWADKYEGQILFSDKEDSTLNFEGGGVHQEQDSNIGTMDHLKEELMGMS